MLTGRLLLCLSLASLACAQTPAFSALSSLPAQKAPLAITTADFNGDGKPDIAVVNAAAASVSIYLGTGAGAFSAVGSASLPADCESAFITSGKFTGATGPDLLVVCALGEVVVLPNTGQGTFGAPRSNSVPEPSWVGNLLLGDIHPGIADFNGDGNLDLAVPTFNFNSVTGGWYLLLGKGNGFFQAPSPLPFTGLVPASLAAGDFNGDGNADLVAITGDASGTINLEFAAGQGDGTFLPPTKLVLSPSIATLILPADVNGDGKLDLVMAGTDGDALSNAASQGRSSVWVFLGDGKGGFKQSFEATEFPYMSGAALSNILGRGKLDLVEAMIQGDFFSGGTASGFIEIRPGKGDGTFGSPITLDFPSSTVPTDVTVADFDGDGRPDIAFPSVPAAGFSLGAISLASDLGTLLKQVLDQLPTGNFDVLLNLTPSSTFSDTNGASFATGPVAANSIVSAFGTSLAASIASAAIVPLPTTLADVTIAVRDSAGATRNAPLFYVSPTQINYAIPDGTALGAATITIQSGASSFTATQQIASVAPGLFSANGMAVGSTVRNVNGVQQTTPLIKDGALVPVDVSDGQTYLVLYGTGIRNHATPAVVTIGTTQITAAYAGAQGLFVGEDQINLQLPARLKGAGTIALSVEADDQTSNSVQVLIQ